MSAGKHSAGGKWHWIVKQMSTERFQAQNLPTNNCESKSHRIAYSLAYPFKYTWFNFAPSCIAGPLLLPLLAWCGYLEGESVHVKPWKAALVVTGHVTQKPKRDARIIQHRCYTRRRVFQTVGLVHRASSNNRSVTALLSAQLCTTCAYLIRFCNCKVKCVHCAVNMMTLC